MQVKTYDNRSTMSRAAARHSSRTLREAIDARGGVRIVAATGASQTDFLGALTAAPDIDWTRVEMFHLDEYVGLPLDHPASFRRYLLDRLIERTGIRRYHLLDGERDAAREADRVGRELAAMPVDVAFVGIGENGHLAFNDPPARLDDPQDTRVVELDDVSRRQQVDEGHFPTVEAVPRRAITVTIPRLLRARHVVASVPGAEKRDAVRATLTAPVGPDHPGTALRTHPDVALFLDEESAPG